MKVTQVLFALMITNIALAGGDSTVLDNSRKLESSETPSFDSLENFEITDELLDKLENIKSVTSDDDGNVHYNPILKIGNPEENQEKPNVTIEEMDSQIKDIFSAVNRNMTNKAEGLVAQTPKTAANLWLNGCYVYDTPCGCGWYNSCCIQGSYMFMIYKLNRWIRYFAGLPCHYMRMFVKQAMISRNTFNCSPVIFQLIMVFVDQYVHYRCIFRLW